MYWRAGSRGPRKMQVALPGLDENDQILRWKDGQGPGSGAQGGGMKHTLYDCFRSYV